MPKFSEKFIAFVDILGFERMVEELEKSESRDVSRLIDLTESLGSAKDALRYAVEGPHICPESPHLQKGLDFCVTQISDCIVVSAEISPAGIISLVGHCHSICVRLMNKNALCRGMITQGNIYHAPSKFFGTGYMKAYRGEKDAVRMLSTNEISSGGPFIQIDKLVAQYVANQPNKCVKDMFERMTHNDEFNTAIYPFHALAESHFATVDKDFDPNIWKESVTNHRDRWLKLRDEFNNQAREAPERARAKIAHYRNGMDHIISRAEDRLASLNEMILTGRIPYGTTWIGI